MLGPGRAGNPYAGMGTAEGAIVTVIPYGEQQFAAAPGLLVVCRSGIGYDAIDVEAATRHGIAVCNVPHGPTVSTAEHATALMMAAAKRVIQAGNRLRAGRGDYYQSHEAVELDGKTLGLVGFGRIARRVAAAGAGLGMKPLAYDPYLEDKAFPPSVERASTFEELLTRGDVVSVHIPFTPENARIFDAEAFALMKPGALFINSARGRLVDHDALIEALDRGHLFGAGLDVTDPEPLDPDHPLLHRPDVTVTPHIASATAEGRVRIFRAALEQVIMTIEGRRPPHLVNPEVWQRVRRRLASVR